MLGKKEHWRLNSTHPMAKNCSGDGIEVIDCANEWNQDIYPADHFDQKKRRIYYCVVMFTEN